MTSYHNSFDERSNTPTDNHIPYEGEHPGNDAAADGTPQYHLPTPGTNWEVAPIVADQGWEPPYDPPQIVVENAPIHISPAVSPLLSPFAPSDHEYVPNTPNSTTSELWNPQSPQLQYPLSRSASAPATHLASPVESDYSAPQMSAAGQDRFIRGLIDEAIRRGIPVHQAITVAHQAATIYDGYHQLDDGYEEQHLSDVELNDWETSGSQD